VARTWGAGHPATLHGEGKRQIKSEETGKEKEKAAKMSETVKRPRKLIVDTDGGIDDLLALALAIKSPEVEIIAITTVRS
jgi:hypothetical protein